MDKKLVKIPADVPKSMHKEFVNNFLAATKDSGRLMLFAGDQKIEHLNYDFCGKGIAEDDCDPEHFFRIASHSVIGAFASQYGMICKYGRDYPDIDYIIKINSKTNLVETKQNEPLSLSLVDIEDVLLLKKNSDLKIRGIGYTIYLGSEYEAEMLSEAGRLIAEAHRNGMIAVI